jgi:signal transduction histidine kinase
MLDTTIIDFLKQTDALGSVPDAQLSWLVEHSNCKTLEEGDFIFRRGEPADDMIIVLSGKLKLYIQQQNSTKEMGFFEPGDISGLLPFSRLKTAIGFAQACQTSEVLLTHRDKMPELVAQNYELAQALVQLMTSRVRDFTSTQQQDEKMMALGKLSAGLAHELNNPASAIARSSDSLLRHLKNTPERFKQVIMMEVDVEQVDAVNKLLFQKLGELGQSGLSMREKIKLEDEFLDWLEDREIDNADDITENLLEFNFSPSDLDRLEEILTPEVMSPVFNWINNVMTTEKTVQDIHKSSTRIAELVQSVKSYSHMDRAQDAQRIAILTGIRDTLNLLSYKIKNAKIDVMLEVDENLQVDINPGQINQVWTNLIDNAIDALEETSEPRIMITSKLDRDRIRIEMEDNGPGIPEEIRSQIFDPFFTTKTVGKGSGMGLDISAKIVRGAGGDIQVVSQPGKTVFSVILPIPSNNK